jgi:DNA repair protein RadC
LAERETPLRDSELLAILIGGGSGEESALDLAHRMVARVGGRGGIASASVGELLKSGGIGNAKVSRIRAAAEIGRRVATEPVNSGMAIRGSQQVFEHYRERMKGLKKETFSCLMLDTRHHLIRKEEVAVGSLNESVVHPREVFKSAINVSAAAVLFVHNHPSGNPQPSPQDRQLTKRLCEAGKLIGIQVLDHLIIGHERYYSFAENGEVTA